MRSRKTLLLFVLFVLLLANIVLWSTLYGEDRKLKVSFLDVGQGDAILIESPTGTDVLIDGGRSRSVLREMGKRLGPLDRTIDLVVATHPDADHIGGLPEVFDRYKIHTYLSSSVQSDTNPSRALISAVSNEETVAEITARRGQRIHLGGGAYMDVLFPDREVANVETNTGSIVVHLVYGNSSFMFTGDAPNSIEEWLVSLDGGKLQSTVLKAGHHGSRTSSSETFLNTVDPEIVVISAGKDNSYGHPHAEVLDRIAETGATTLSTYKEGTIVLVSDGKSIVLK